MLELSHLLDFAGLTLAGTRREADRLVVALLSGEPSPACPTCGRPSASLHSHYARRVHDLPTGGNEVVLELRVRRFRCREPTCPRRVFCERLPGLPAWARRTNRQRGWLEHLAVALGGRAAARLASKLHLAAGRTTFLRAIGSMPLPAVGEPRAVGIDDFALKKGHTYGTVIVDLETHRPLDLLPDRKADTVAEWLKRHPSVEVVTRDRAREYAQGVTDGAPTAKQVVDRWHLLKNLRETLERTIDAHRKVINEIALRAGAAVSLPRSRKETEASQAARERRRTLYEKVLEQFGRLGSINATAKAMGVSRYLVRQAIRVDGRPEFSSGKRQASLLDAFEPFLLERWAAGVRSGKALWSELRERGFDGNEKLVQRWARRQRLAESASSTGNIGKRVGRGFSTWELGWLLLREDERLSVEERDRLALLERGVPAVGVARSLAAQFVGAMRERRPEGFDTWLVEATSSDTRALREFAVGLSREGAAIRAAFEVEWSNGPVEGVVNKIKLVKRQMFGRASFELLRRRVLLAT